MSVSAGRVLPIPKGAYVAGTTYQMLDVVSYNGNAYVAKRQNTNVTPTDGADWMLLVQGGGVSSFNGRIGAVTPTDGDYDADQIDYDPTDSGLTATDVQEAIDELASRPSDVTSVFSVMGEMGAKNLIKYPYQETTHTDHGITWTDNGDGTVTANGTATADSTFICSSRAQRDLIIPNGEYVLTGCPSDGALNKYYIGAGRTYNNAFDSLGSDLGSGVEVTLNGDDTDPNTVGLQIIIQIKSGQTINNVIFKPMLRLASDSDPTYQPYAKTNRELTEDVGHWTTVVNSLVGDTTATFIDAMIKTTSIVDVYSENANGDITAIDGVTVTNGQAVVRFPALTVATSFKLWIR